jgi:hypothetical protein
MANGSDARLMTRPRRLATCRFAWCAGRYCRTSAVGERFHFTNLATEESTDETTHVGVDLVCNDFVDATSTGPLVELTWAHMDADGVTERSAELTPQAALRYAAAITHAAQAAMATRDQ